MGTKELGHLKSLSLKIQETTSKSVVISEEKGKQFVRQIIYINQRHLSTKVTPVINFTDKPVIQSEVPLVEKLLQISFDVNTFLYSLGTNSGHSFSF